MKPRHSLLLALAFCLVLPAYAQEDAGTDNAAYLSAFLADFEGSSDKLNQLANAFSEELYSWRPAEGIRSVSEVFVHVANANIYIASTLGYSMEMDRPEDPEENITAKADVVADLAMSQDHVRELVKVLMEKDLGEEISMFGDSMSVYQVLMILGGHSHEHLGQAIAYARSNGVAPPWSGGGG